MKINQTIFCITIINIIEIILMKSCLSIMLWIGYGLYKMDERD